MLTKKYSGEKEIIAVTGRVHWNVKLHFLRLSLLIFKSGNENCSDALGCRNTTSIVFNPQTTARGPCGPRNFLIRASKVNIRIPETVFHLILHNTEPLSRINWFLTHDTPSPVKLSLRARKWLGSVRTPVSISSHCFERKEDINLNYLPSQEASTWVWVETLIHGNLLCTSHK